MKFQSNIFTFNLNQKQMFKARHFFYSVPIMGLIFIGMLYTTGFGISLRKKIKIELLGTGLIQPKLDSTPINGEFDFSGTILDNEGKEINISDFKGKTLFINIWASWCGPCRAEKPYINSLYEKVKDRENLEFLMIAKDDDFTKTKDYVNQNGFSFPIYHAHNGLNSSLETESIPMTLVINSEGKIIFSHTGMTNFNNEKFKNFLLSQ